MQIYDSMTDGQYRRAIRLWTMDSFTGVTLLAEPVNIDSQFHEDALGLHDCMHLLIR